MHADDPPPNTEISQLIAELVSLRLQADELTRTLWATVGPQHNAFSDDPAMARSAALGFRRELQRVQAAIARLVDNPRTWTHVQCSAPGAGDPPGMRRTLGA